jgi:hypothetical protein
MSLRSREFLIWKERERGGKREKEGRPGRSAGGIFKVRLGLVETGIKRHRKTKKQRYIETELTIKIPSKAG